MNYKQATTILGLTGKWDKDMLKKAYRKSALRYHPDKNSSTEASMQFDMVKNAFEYLLLHSEYDYANTHMNSANTNANTNKKDDNYMFDKEAAKEELIKLFNMIRPMQPEKVDQLFNACKTVIGITKDIVKENLKKEDKKEVKYELEVTLQQMLNDTVYTLKHNNKDYKIPLWFDELCFEEENEIININIIPLIKNNITINSDNHITIQLTTEDVKTFDVKHIQSINSNQIKIDITKLTKDAKLTLWNVGLLKIAYKDNGKIDMSERQGVTIKIV